MLKLYTHINVLSTTIVNYNNKIHLQIKNLNLNKIFIKIINSNSVIKT